MDHKEDEGSYQEDEDDVIQKIKTIGSEIFTSFSDNQFSSRKFDQDMDIMGFNNAFAGEKGNANDRKYSYTERNYRTDNDAEVNQHHHESRNVAIVKNDKKQQKNKNIIPEKTKNATNRGSPLNFKKKVVEKKKQQRKIQQKDNQMKEISNSQPPALVSSRFMQPIGNFKQKLIEDIYEKTLKQELEHKQNMAKKKSMRSLEQLYQEKEPLYQRFIRDQFKKKMKLEESRVEAMQKQLQDCIGVPQINKNIQIKGSFMERNDEKKTKKQENRHKIIHQMMKNTTFQPHISSPERYKNIESKVARIWKHTQSKTLSQEQSSSQNSGRSIDLKGISQQMVRTGSFFSDESKDSPSKNKSLQLKIKSIQELSHILEIDDIED